MGTRIQMKGTGTGGAQDQIAQIDVPLNGNIVGVTWNTLVDLDADLEYSLLQLSFGSAFMQSNDSRAVISTFSSGQVSTVTGVGEHVNGGNFSDALMTIPVSMGERIFMHALASAGVSTVAYATIDFDFDIDRPLARRR